jgi:hypothetical protein
VYRYSTGKKIGIGANLIVAALAGCCNVLITEPLDTLSTRRQIAGIAAEGSRGGGDDGATGGKAGSGGEGTSAGAGGGEIVVTEDTSWAGPPRTHPKARALWKTKLEKTQNKTGPGQ